MENDLKIKDGESLDQYALRLYFVERIKHGITKYDVADLLNAYTGENKSESAWRKHYYSFKKGFELGKLMGVEEQAEELRQERLEIDKAIIKLRSERVLINRKKCEMSRTEAIYEQILEYVDGVKVEPRKLTPITGYDEYGCIFAISDLHIGSKDEYNDHQTLLNRMDKILEKAIFEIKQMDVHEVNLLICGDVIDGLLRISQLRKLEFMVGEQIVRAVDTLAMFIRELADHDLKVNVHMTTFGNHAQARYFGTGRNEMDEDDLEYVIREMLDRIFIDDENVTIVNYKDLVEFELCGKNILALHGSEFNVKIDERFVKNISYDRQKYYDVIYVGHFHRFGVRTVCDNERGGVELVNVPSMTFANDHAKRYLLSSPSGGILDFYSKDGFKKTVRVYA